MRETRPVKVEIMGQAINPREYKIALLAGGMSKERDISVASGKGAGAALEAAGFEVETVDPAEADGLKRLIDGKFDVAFSVLHGRMGEDGTMQGFLELIELPYTGSGVWSSATAMDKVKSKLFYEQVGIRTPGSITVVSGDGTTLEQILEVVGNKSVVKPPKEGSSFGISIVEGAEELESALESVLASDGEALVETFVAGREFTVPVLGNAEASALPVIEIVPRGGFYDFDSKYAPGGSEHLCPAPLTEEETRTVQELGVRAHQVLECRGVSRSDFILDDVGQFWILETNTLPGMTDTSLLPDAARAAEMSFPELCVKMVELALE